MGSIKAVINQSSLASHLEWIEGKQRGMKKELFITGQSKRLPARKLGHFCHCGSERTWNPFYSNESKSDPEFSLLVPNHIVTAQGSE